MNPGLSCFLNFARWAAALLVVISHMRLLLFCDYQALREKTLALKIIYLATSLGHEAVVFFFVISGFLVGGVTLDRWNKSGARLRDYSIARFSRIYIVLLPALILGFGFDIIGWNWFNSNQIYTDAARADIGSLNSHINMTLNFMTFVGNTLLLNGIWTDNLGSNGPLWSLAYEWWYYVLFASFAGAANSSGLRRILCIITGIIVLKFLPINILLWGAIWMLGVLAFFWAKSSKLRPSLLVGTIVLGAVLASAKFISLQKYSIGSSGLIATFVRDFSIGISFSLALVSASGSSGKPRFPIFHEKLAAFSYTLYLTHFPLMLLIVAMGFHYFRLPLRAEPTMGGIFYFVGVVTTVYLSCFAISLLTESHTNAFRAILGRGALTAETWALFCIDHARRTLRRRDKKST